MTSPFALKPRRERSVVDCSLDHMVLGAVLARAQLQAESERRAARGERFGGAQRGAVSVRRAIVGRSRGARYAGAD